MKRHKSRQNVHESEQPILAAFVQIEEKSFLISEGNIALNITKKSQK